MTAHEPATTSPAPTSTRTAVLEAAIGVVERAGTPAVTIAAIAHAAGVPADEASALFSSVDDLLVEAALRMCVDDLRLEAIARSAGAPTVSAYALHFARRRDFYRAMRIGPVAAQLDARMAAVMAPLIAVQIRTVVGTRIGDDLLRQMTVEVTEESFAVTNRWILASGPHEGAESLYLLLEAIVLRGLDEARRLLARGE